MWRHESNHHHNSGHSHLHHAISDFELLKDIKLEGLRAYWNREERCPLIPTSLLESTRELEHQIFEAIDVNDLKI
jgi:hypothetical protein